MGTVVAIILAVILGILVGALVYGKILRKRKEHYQDVYTRILVLDYFVRNCSINTSNASSIEDNLKDLRADELMSEKEICDSVSRISRVYNERFKPILQ